MVAGAAEGWGVVQSRERILVAYIYLLAAAAAGLDYCDKL